MKKSKEEIRAKSVSIRLVVSDVDGTLTDGALYYSSEGEVMKRFSVHDGMGIRLLLQAGIQVVLLTSDAGTISHLRAQKLGVQHVLSGIEDKATALKNLVTSLNISLEETLYIGDDVNDLPAMQLCGLKACPNNAMTRIREISDVVTEAKAGLGAVREIAELLLECQQKPNIFQ
jgi:3-deoxy-D-manno-octulosonate 8-phosphate phosphatase (KDO 8-P phosphatase)